MQVVPAGPGLDHALSLILQEWIPSTEAETQREVYARQITSLCDVQDVEGFCWSLWQAFIDTAQSVPQETALAQMDKLVQLVKAIKESEPLLDENGRSASFWGGECWKDLPLLGPQMRENWNESPSTSSALEAHVNKHLFAARLTYHQVADFSLYGLWALREAFEAGESWFRTSHFDATIPLAHVWIMHTGGLLFNMHDDRGALGRGGPLWKGQSGFCTERWQFWRRRLDEISGSSDFARKTRELAKEAADRIEQLLS